MGESTGHLDFGFSADALPQHLPGGHVPVPPQTGFFSVQHNLLSHLIHAPGGHLSSSFFLKNGSSGLLQHLPGGQPKVPPHTGAL